MKIIFVLILFYFLHDVELLDVPVITQVQDVRGFADDIGTGKDSMAEVIEKIDAIMQRTKNLDIFLDELLASLSAQLPYNDQVNTDIDDLQDYFYEVDEIYDSFLIYSKDVSNVDNKTLTDFVTDVTSDKRRNIPNILQEMFSIIVPEEAELDREGFLENLAQKIETMNALEMCNPQISYQNRLLQIYNLIVITEIKALLMTSFAYRLKNGDQSKDEIDQARNEFITRLDQYLMKFKNNMLDASRDIFFCDPESLTDQGTFVELEGLFQAYVLNEYELSTDDCWTTCPEIHSWGLYRCYDLNKKTYCPKHPCKGLIHDCGWIGGDVDICEYNEDMPKRYNYVRSYGNDVFYGRWSECGENMIYQQVNGRLLRGFRCDMCMCKCEETYGSSKAIRTFSLRPQISNIEENKVVSDVKFVEKDKMIHIQIEEAPLLPVGQLDRSQSSWVPLEEFIYLSNVTGGDWVQVKDGQNIPMTRDTDFAFIRIDQKVMNLDEISGGPNYVLTGVKLSHESEKYIEGDELAGNVSPLQLEIHVTPFDYAEGKLVPTEENPSIWLTPTTQPNLPQAYDSPRGELKTGDKVYRWSTVPNPPNFQPNQYIKFHQSSIFDDVGQSTIPFMDSRPTAPSSPLAFDGLGLMYRGHEKFGGFILLKTMTMDLTNYMSSSDE